MNKPQNKGLIKKSTKNKILKPSTPIKKIQNEDFSYSLHQRTPLLQKKESSKKQQERLSNQKTFVRAALTKNNGKSIKITQEVLEEIQLLGSFINESVIYKIIGELLDSYIKNELSDRQQRQFEFMLNKKFNSSS